VELDAPQGPRAVLEPHDDVVGRPRRHAQVRRHRTDGEGVVAHGREALRDAGEQAAPIVIDLAQPPVHDLGSVADRAAADVGERLVTEADAEQRHLRLVGSPDEVHADAGLVGRARAGGEHDTCRF